MIMMLTKQNLLSGRMMLMSVLEAGDAEPSDVIAGDAENCVLEVSDAELCVEVMLWLCDVVMAG